ncbi:MAG: carbohydrate kinase family protein [Terriglobia bacterium]
MPRFDLTVAGELNLDLILYGLPEDLPTERELLADRLSVTLGSSSAIFAHNLAVLGSRVGFISRVGDDPLGQIALDRLAASGADVSKTRKVSGPTKTGLTVILPHTDSRRILTYPGTMLEMCFEDLDLDYLSDSKHFHLSSYFLHRALRPRIVELFQRMKKAGLTTSLDTNDDPDDLWGGDLRELLRHVDVFLPNAREARLVSGVDDLEGAVARLAGFVPLLVVKLGAEGAMAQRGNERIQSPPPIMKEAALDPVGAGDSFDAGFLHQFIRGADIATCLAYGNLAGAFSTTRPGGTEAFRDRQYFEEFFRRHWTRDAHHTPDLISASTKVNL